jgi:hypothetical protein
MISKKFLRSLLGFLLSTTVFLAFEDELMNLFNDPKFPGEATGSAIVMVLLFAVYAKFLTDVYGGKSDEPKEPVETK